MNNVKLLKKSDADLEEINKLICNSLKIINLSTHFRTAMVGLHIKVFLLTAIYLTYSDLEKSSLWNSSQEQPRRSFQ